MAAALQRRILLQRVHERQRLRIARLLAGQGFRILQHHGQFVEEFLRIHLGRFAAAWGARRFGEGGILRPVVLLQLSVELRQRVHVDLRHQRLHGGAILRRVEQRDARDHVAGVGAGAEDFGDALRHVAFPVGTGEQVEARLRAIHLAEVDETVGARVDDLVHPEPVAEVRHLEHHRLDVERQRAAAVHNVLVGAGDFAFGRRDVVGEHHQTVGRRRRKHAAELSGAGQILEAEPAVVDVHHRPRPEVCVARGHAHVGLGEARAGDGARHGGRGRWRRGGRWCGGGGGLRRGRRGFGRRLLLAGRERSRGDDGESERVDAHGRSLSCGVVIRAHQERFTSGGGKYVPSFTPPLGP